MLVLPGLFLAAAACGQSSDIDGRVDRASEPGYSASGQKPVSVVDGMPVSISELQEAVRQTDLSPREALSRLQAQRLLMAEAERRGFADDPEVRQTAKRAAVQALLIEEAENLGVSSRELRKAYDKADHRFRRPELRGSSHVLAKMPPHAPGHISRAGERFAREVIDAFARTDDVRTVLEQYQDHRSESFEVVAERLPPYPLEGALAKEYAQALFEPSQPGVVSHPVRTSFGWHAIYVTDIHPGRNVPLVEAAEVLRPEVLLEKQKLHVQAFIDGLRKQTEVVENEPAIEWFLKMELAVMEGR